MEKAHIATVPRALPNEGTGAFAGFINGGRTKEKELLFSVRCLDVRPYSYRSETVVHTGDLEDEKGSRNEWKHPALGRKAKRGMVDPGKCSHRLSL